ncbi:hypothetical protein PUNSTDRAFT_120793 [Punctularia strigosozonata HHB-11173 SS5]|uniref:uncharacterized protein n=1 Tax=Punctularia strigosozonata (strain HHB-11173) TaxID=741275 RepID=UPI0004418540|nr:uncharacterized protein PUNSTDRAFT_120793 [Punctularia strigosozonata HHB-11173 SS5]EIN08438.1 hypothetical protein PUNSTDRAFT_120793 [Punctularia strigosozonata HHB-11173 SS5]
MQEIVGAALRPMMAAIDTCAARVQGIDARVSALTEAFSLMPKQDSTWKRKELEAVKKMIEDAVNARTGPTVALMSGIDSIGRVLGATDEDDGTANKSILDRIAAIEDGLNKTVEEVKDLDVLREMLANRNARHASITAGATYAEAGTSARSSPPPRDFIEIGVNTMHLAAPPLTDPQRRTDCAVQTDLIPTLPAASALHTSAAQLSAPASEEPYVMQVDDDYGHTSPLQVSTRLDDDGNVPSVAHEGFAPTSVRPSAVGPVAGSGMQGPSSPMSPSISPLNTGDLIAETGVDAPLVPLNIPERVPSSVSGEEPVDESLMYPDDEPVQVVRPEPQPAPLGGDSERFRRLISKVASWATAASTPAPGSALAEFAEGMQECQASTRVPSPQPKPVTGLPSPPITRGPTSASPEVQPSPDDTIEDWNELLGTASTSVTPTPDDVVPETSLIESVSIHEMSKTESIEEYPPSISVGSSTRPEPATPDGPDMHSLSSLSDLTDIEDDQPLASISAPLPARPRKRRRTDEVLVLSSSNISLSGRARKPVRREGSEGSCKRCRTNHLQCDANVTGCAKCRQSGELCVRDYSGPQPKRRRAQAVKPISASPSVASIRSSGSNTPAASKVRKKAASFSARGSKVQWPTVVKLENDICREFIGCDKCLSWYHNACVGIMPNDIRLDEDATFLCPPCEAGVRASSKPTNDEFYCARPDCEAPTNEGEYVVEAIVGRRLDRTSEDTKSPQYIWLVLWDGYSISYATWETDVPNLERHVAKFEAALRKERITWTPWTDGLLLRVAVDGGWKPSGSKK